jgi:prepilin peptidase CpaA
LAVFGGFTKELLQRTGDLLMSWRKQEAESSESIPESEKRKIPYAPAIAVGTLLSFFAR